MSRPILEKEAQGIVDATSTPPFLYELGPEGARISVTFAMPRKSSFKRRLLP